VIEESAGNMALSKKTEIIEFLEKNNKGLSVEKGVLLNALITALN
jgi:hypothetical protein